MLRNKRRPSRGAGTRGKSNPNGKFKQKSLEEKLKNVKDDEEIISSGGEEEGDIENDEFFEDEENIIQGGKKVKTQSKRIENADEKRLRLAKKLISQIGEEKGAKDEEEEVDIDQYIIDEIKKEKQDYFQELSSLPTFNPVSGSIMKGHLSSVTAIDISSDSKSVISVSKDCRAMKWDLESGKKILLPQFTNKPLYACTYTPDNKYALFGGADKHIHQMDLQSGEIVQSFKAHNADVMGIVFDQNKDQYYSCSRDNTLKVWAVGTTQKSVLIETFYGHIDRINDMDIMSGTFDTTNTSGSNRILTCGSDRQIHLWKVDTQSFLQFKENENIFSYDCIKALDKDHFLTSSYDGCLSLWRSNKKKPICKIPNAHGFEKTVKIEHDFFSKSAENFKNVNLSQNEEDKKFSLPYPILSLSCIKNSDLLFSASCDGFLNIYRLIKGNNKINVKEKIELIKKIDITVNGNKSCINAMKVSKNNDFIVLAHGKDGRLGRWDCEKKSKNGISIVKLFDK